VETKAVIASGRPGPVILKWNGESGATPCDQRREDIQLLGGSGEVCFAREVGSGAVQCQQA
jgi:hypothetical protein